MYAIHDKYAMYDIHATYAMYDGSKPADPSGTLQPYFSQLGVPSSKFLFVYLQVSHLSVNYSYLECELKLVE